MIFLQVEDWANFYWMTDSLSGDQLSIYGSELRYNFFWGVVRGDAGGEPTKEPGVILLGKGNKNTCKKKYIMRSNVDLSLSLPKLFLSPTLGATVRRTVSQQST